MKNISHVDPVALSKFINILRGHLASKGFFEYHLYSTQDYKIEGARTFQIKPELYLRYNPEPDIWQIGNQFDKFFWIGSMYRDEERLTRFHRYEFTVMDVYMSNGKVRDVVGYFIEYLKVLEKGLKLKNKLSRLPVKFCKYKEFKMLTRTEKERAWYVVTGYPKDESFYDELEAGGDATRKFEIFHYSTGRVLEIAACGILGENHNPKMFVRDGKKFLQGEVLRKKFVGFGMGIERLMYLYCMN